MVLQSTIPLTPRNLWRSTRGALDPRLGDTALSPNRTCYLSLGDEVGHNGSVSELGCQVHAAAALAVDERGVRPVLKQLHHHGQVALSAKERTGREEMFHN